LASGVYTAGQVVDVDEQDAMLSSLEPVSKKDKDKIAKLKKERAGERRKRTDQKKATEK
jgi:hypothetical protein